MFILRVVSKYVLTGNSQFTKRVLNKMLKISKHSK